MRRNNKAPLMSVDQLADELGVHDEGGVGEPKD